MSDELPTTTQFDSAGLIGRAKAILMTPKEEWPRVATETKSPTQVLLSYALPLIAIVTFVMSVVSLYVFSFIANLVSPKFGGKDDFPAAFRLCAYSMTAAWVVGVVNLLTGLTPVLAILGLLGLYSIYLLYLGATPVMGVPQDKATGYTVVTFVAAIVLYIVAAALVTATTGAFGLAATSAAMASSDQATVDLGELGTVTVDGNNSTVDLGELGRVEVDGDEATLTVDGQTVRVNTEQAAIAAKKAAAAAREAQ